MYLAIRVYSFWFRRLSGALGSSQGRLLQLLSPHPHHHHRPPTKAGSPARLAHTLRFPDYRSRLYRWESLYRSRSRRPFRLTLVRRRAESRAVSPAASPHRAQSKERTSKPRRPLAGLGALGLNAKAERRRRRPLLTHRCEPKIGALRGGRSARNPAFSTQAGPIRSMWAGGYPIRDCPHAQAPPPAHSHATPPEDSAMGIGLVFATSFLGDRVRYSMRPWGLYEFARYSARPKRFRFSKKKRCFVCTLLGRPFSCWGANARKV